MKKKFLITILSLVCALGCAFALAACDNNDSTVHVTRVNLSTRRLELEAGEEATLTAEVLPENATDKTVTWTVDNDRIATVDNNGKVTAISEGEALVRATAGNTFEECQVFVTAKVLVDYISITQNKVTLVVNGETTLDARVSPADAKSEIVWAVEPTGVVSVDGGKLTALAQGEAIVTATADNATAQCYVTVTRDGWQYALSGDGQSYSVEQNYNGLVEMTETEIASEFNGKPVTKIGRWAFSELNDLTKVKIPANITEIDFNSINYCKNLESIEIHENNPKFTSVDGIVYNKAVTQSIHVPYGKKGVVTIPESMTKITDSMFNNRDKITGVIMHDGVTAIGDRAFSGCTGIHSIAIPENMTEIGDYAFSGCYKLWEIYNFSHLKIVTGGDVWTATYGQIGLYALNILYMKNYPSGIHETDDGYTFYTARDNKVYLVDYTGEETDLTLPDGYNGADYEIHSYAFDGCNTITGVTIPNKVTAIGYSAFGHCNNLVSVTVSNSVTKFGSEIFSFSSKLENITYTGTETQWNNIEKPNNWDAYCGDYSIHYTEE